MLITISCSPGQEPDSYDTLRCRGAGYILIRKFDTLSQLEQANKKADTILESLQDIAIKLGINDTVR